MKEQGTVVRVCVVVEVLASRQMKTFHRALAPVRVLYGVRCVRAACTNVGVVCLSKLWCHRCDNNQLTCNWIYSELHWLKVPERVRCVLTYRCLNNTAPHYLAETIRPVSSRGTRQHLRSAETSTLLVPSTRRSTLGDRWFPVAAARAWNALPQHVRNAPSLSIFRRELKTVLFRSSFPDAIWQCTVLYLRARRSVLICHYVLAATNWFCWHCTMVLQQQCDNAT